MAIEAITANASNVQETLIVHQVISDMKEMALSLEVTTEEAFKTITSIYRQVKDWKKIIEQKRKASIEPDRARIAKVNDKAKELTDPLDQIEQITKLKADSYMKLLEEIKKQEEERIKILCDVLDLPNAIIQDTLPPAPPIRGEGAYAYTKVEKKWKAPDLAKVPARYLLLNDAAIKADLRLGVTEIPGIEFYEENITQLRSR